MSVQIVHGDCREVMPALGPFDMIIADPPYGDTSLDWDVIVSGWEAVALQCLKPGGSMWVFGSLRYFMTTGMPDGWLMAQDIVWEKHNGSSMRKDRFRRVHEHAVHFYPASSLWGDIYNVVQTTPDAVAKKVKRSNKPRHFGKVGSVAYESVDGGPRLMRSVVQMRSEHGRAIHETQKPSSLLEILIRTSCPPGGLVGDFFAGSGSAGEACIYADRHYVGAEYRKDCAAQASARLAGILPFGLAA